MKKTLKITEVLGSKINLCEVDVEDDILMYTTNVVHKVECVNGYYALLDYNDKIINITDSFESLIKWEPNYTLDFSTDNLDEYIMINYTDQENDVKRTDKTLDEIVDEYRVIYSTLGQPVLIKMDKLVRTLDAKLLSKKHRTILSNIRYCITDRLIMNLCVHFDKIKSSVKKQDDELCKEISAVTRAYVKEFRKREIL